MPPFVTRGEVQDMLDELRGSQGALIRQLQGVGPDKIGEFSSIGGGRLRIIGIPQVYRHLRIVAQLQGQQAGSTTNGFLQTNFPTPGNTYNWDWVYRGGTQAGDFNGQGGGQTYVFIGLVPAASRANDNFVSTHIIDIPFYSRSDTIKTFDADGIGSTGLGQFWGIKAMSVGDTTTDAIGSIDMGEASGAGLGPRSKATLYGIP